MELDAVRPVGQGLFRDHLDYKAADWFQPWDGKSAFDLALLGAPLSKTSISHSGAFQLPQAVRQALNSYGVYNLEEDVDLSERLQAVDLGDVQMHATQLEVCHDNIHRASRSYWQMALQQTSKAAAVATTPRADARKLTGGNKRRPRLFLLGGDHSITAPSIKGFRDVTDAPLGIIHFDAHHDMRNLEDGGPTNGTPFRRLLEEGVIDGSRLVQIGLRNFANAKAYTHYATSHGVKLVTINQVRRRGIADVLNEALETAGRGGARLYVSFDIDVIDQAFVPGVPAPGPYGLDIWQACEAVQALGQVGEVEAFDWVCADPTVDTRNLTSRVVANLMLYAATGMAL